MSAIRRLPVYLVIDCSESMAGPAFNSVQDGIDTLLAELRGDPIALESVWLSLLTFSAKAKVLTALTDLTEFQAPRLVLGSGTSLGVALTLLEQRMAAEVAVQTAETRELYGGVQSHPIEAFDFDGSQAGLSLSVSSDSLLMAPACPYCGHRHWAKCGSCEQLFCIADGGIKKCPWCGDQGDYRLSDEAFDVGRGMG